MTLNRLSVAAIALTVLSTGCEENVADNTEAIADLQVELETVAEVSNGFLTDDDLQIPADAVFPEDLHALTVEDAMHTLLDMAADEPCDIRGAVAGGFSDGKVVMYAVNPDHEIGVILGKMSEMDFAADMWNGVYKTQGGEMGTVQGTLRRGSDTEPGTFTAGMWTADDPNDVRGHVFGVYVSNPESPDGGLVMGAYAVCSEAV